MIRSTVAKRATERPRAAVEATSAAAEPVETPNAGVERSSPGLGGDEDMLCTLCGLRACWTSKEG